MAVVSLDKKEVSRIIGNLSDDKLNDFLSLFGLGVEKITQDRIDVEVTPNRPDMLSQSGIFRALEAYTGRKTGLRKYKVNKPEKTFKVKIDSSVKNIRPFTACAIIKNLKFDDSKIKEVVDIQEKIHSTLGRNRKKIAIGIYPLEKITLPIKFEARTPKDIKFIPLESNEEMDGLQILQRHPAGREYAHLLSGLDKFPVFCDAKNEILSMPPIINSHKTGKITHETRDIFIECSGFDFEILKKTLNILATMFADIGGEIYQMELDYGRKEITPDLKPEKLKLNSEHVNKLLGLDLKEQEMKKLLERMGYDYKNKEVEIPAYRADIMHEVDLIEDIAIAYGYDKFIPEIPEISTVGEENPKEIFKRKISEILAGLGMLENSSLHLLTAEDLKKSEVKGMLEVQDSKTDYRFLRSNMLTSSLKILSENVDVEYPQKIFELGVVFSKDDKEETGILEKNSLVCSLAPGNFTEIKQVLEYLGKMIGKEFKIEETRDSRFIDGRCGKILLNGKEIGVIGELHPQILKSWHIKMPASSFELEVCELMS
jgi:phenylalanyl-tRNA synthetase beta chain